MFFVVFIFHRSTTHWLCLILRDEAHQRSQMSTPWHKLSTGLSEEINYIPLQTIPIHYTLSWHHTAAKDKEFRMQYLCWTIGDGSERHLSNTDLLRNQQLLTLVLLVLPQWCDFDSQSTQCSTEINVKPKDAANCWHQELQHRCFFFLVCPQLEMLTTWSGAEGWLLPPAVHKMRHFHWYGQSSVPRW